MKSYWTVANLLSLGNASCGILSIFCAASHQLNTASCLMLTAVVFDFLDGKTARFFQQDSLFGKGLDCLSDVISFGVAPAVLGHLVSSPNSFLVQIILVLFVLAGAWRLAYFYQWQGTRRPPGMPITLNGLGFPLLFFLHAPAELFPAAFALSTLVMVGPIFASRPAVS